MNRGMLSPLLSFLILAGCFENKEEEAQKTLDQIAEAYVSAENIYAFDENKFKNLSFAAVELARVLEDYQETSIVTEFRGNGGAYGLTHEKLQKRLRSWRYLNQFEGSSAKSTPGLDVVAMKLTNQCLECVITDTVSPNALALIKDSELISPKFFKMNLESFDFGNVSISGSGVGAFFPLNFSAEYSNADMETQARYVPEFTFSNLSEASLNAATLDNVVFLETLLVQAKLTGATFRDVAFIGVDATSAQFSSTFFDDEFSQEPIENKNIPYSESRLKDYQLHYHWGGRALIYDSIFVGSNFKNVNQGQGFEKKMGRDFGLTIFNSDLSESDFSRDIKIENCRHDILSVNSKLEGMNFIGCDVTLSADNTSFDRSIFSGSDVYFSVSSGKISAQHCDFSKSTFRLDISLIEDGIHLDFKNSNFSFARIDFGNRYTSHSLDLDGANFQGVNARAVNFDGATLKGANFTDADLDNASFVNADLTGVKFNGASLTNADLSGANLSFAILHGIDLQGAILENTNFCGAIGPDGEKMQTGCQIP